MKLTSKLCLKSLRFEVFKIGYSTAKKYMYLEKCLNWLGPVIMRLPQPTRYGFRIVDVSNGAFRKPLSNETNLL